MPERKIMTTSGIAHVAGAGASTYTQPANKYTSAEFAEAFPNVAPGHKPFGSRVIVQIRSPKTKTKGGLFLPTDTQDTEKWNTQIGRIVALGPLSFKNRDTQDYWPEGEWAKVGDFVRVPKWNQDRWEVQNGDGLVLFMLINDLDLLASVDCDPLDVKAYI